VSIDGGGLATQVNDLSGSGNHLLKAAAGVAPPFDWVSEFNGQIAVDFANTPSLRALFTTIPQPFTVAMVMSTDRTTGQVLWDSANPTTNAFLWANGAGTPRFEMRAGATLTGATTTVTVGTKYLVIGQFDGANSKIWVNDVTTPEASGNAGTNGLSNGITVAATRQAIPGTPLDGRAPEIVVVPRNLTADELGALAQYAADWYGVSTVGGAVPPDFGGIEQPQSALVVLLWGQSNASGDPDGGTLASQSGYATEYPVPHTYNVNGSAAGPTFTKEQATDVYGSEIAIARRLVEAQRRGVLVKVSLGSTHLAPQVAADDWAPSSAELFTTLKDRASPVLAALDKFTLVSAGVQGEADADVSAEASAYSANLTDFNDQLQADLGVSFAKVVHQRLNPGWTSLLGFWSTFETQLTSWASAYPNAVVVDDPAGGLIVGDEIHRTGARRLSLGQTYASLFGIPG
jgi:hypothetical protein